MEKHHVRRRDEVRLRGREKIVYAAASLFMHRGFHGVSLEAIACEAGVDVGTLRRLYASKEDLYSLFLMTQWLACRNAMIEAMAQSDDEIEMLRNFVSKKIELARNKKRD